MPYKTRIRNIRVLRDILEVKRPSQSKLTYAWMKQFMSIHCPKATVDRSNNYYYEIKGSNGERSPVGFTSHYDTVHDTFGIQKLVRDDDILSAKDSVLGADDGAGMFLMLMMIKNKVPGFYVFFADEEVGCVGSSEFDKSLTSHLKAIISFDRKGENEVITHQCGSECASEIASQWLCDELGLGYVPSDKGAFTDSLEFADSVSECFNVSVGYYNQHTKNEYLNLGHLNRLLSKLLTIDWFSIPSVRVPTPKWDRGLDNSYYSGYSTLDRWPTGDRWEMIQFVKNNPQMVADFLINIGADITEVEIESGWTDFDSMDDDELTELKF